MVQPSDRALDAPTLVGSLYGATGVPLLTDDALASAIGVRIAFTGRAGGVSASEHAALNLGAHVGDSPGAVAENRARVLRAIGASGAPLIVARQVHGTRLVALSDSACASVREASAQAELGADGLVVGVRGVAALLAFADCLPLILVSPTGRFAIVHAGWRGALARIASGAARSLARLDGACDADEQAKALALCNAYIGPYIHHECFEVGAELAARFESAFGSCAVPSPRHVDLGAVVANDLVAAGMLPSRIADAGICTRCHADACFSYRATQGACGRHGALAVRM